jgi:hypothetical protein
MHPLLKITSKRRSLSAVPEALHQSRRTPAPGLCAAAPVVLIWALGTGIAAAQPPAPAPDHAAGPAQSPTAGRGPGLDPLPAGSVIAFVPSAGGFTGTTAELRAWLAARGWAICDGTGGTPDLRDRMLLGTTDAGRVGQRLGSRDHDHRVRGETGAPALRNRHTRVGLAELRHLPDDQHRHGVDLASDRAGHLPPSTLVLFIMKLR